MTPLGGMICSRRQTRNNTANRAELCCAVCHCGTPGRNTTTHYSDIKGSLSRRWPPSLVMHRPVNPHDTVRHSVQTFWSNLTYICLWFQFHFPLKQGSSTNVTMHYFHLIEQAVLLPGFLEEDKKRFTSTDQQRCQLGSMCVKVLTETRVQNNFNQFTKI